MEGGWKGGRLPLKKLGVQEESEGTRPLILIFKNRLKNFTLTPQLVMIWT